LRENSVRVHGLEVLGEVLRIEMVKVDLLGLRIIPASAESALEEAGLLSDDVPVNVELFLVVALANDGLDERRANEATTMLVDYNRLELL